MENDSSKGRFRLIIGRGGEDEARFDGEEEGRERRGREPYVLVTLEDIWTEKMVVESKMNVQLRQLASQ